MQSPAAAPGEAPDLSGFLAPIAAAAMPFSSCLRDATVSLSPFAQQLIAVITFCCQFATFLLVPESTQQLPLSRRVRLRSAPVALSASNRASLFCSDGRRNSDRSTRRLHFAGTLKTANCVHVMLA